MEFSTWGTIGGLDRLAEMRELVRRDPPPPYDVLGLEIGAAEKGRVEVHWTPGERQLNRGGVVHGGWIAAALDEVGGLAAVSTSNPAVPHLTMSLGVDYLRPLRAGVPYTVTGRVLQGGNTRVLIRVEITDPEGVLHAQASSSMTPNRKFMAAAKAAREAEEARAAQG